MKRVWASLVVAAVALSPLGVVHAHGVSAQGNAFTYVHVCGTTVAPGYVRCFAILRVNTLAPDAGSPGGYNPADLQAAYKLPSSTAGQGQVLADVLWHDDPNAESDMNHYRSQFGLPPCTTANGCFKKVDQNGGTNYPQPDASVALETSLDLDMFSAICPRCKIVLVEATTNSFQDVVIAEDQAAKQGATEISNSYGGSETANETTQFDPHYNHPGIAITVSSGDHGYAAGPQYPAASRYVTAVGGTSLKRAPGTPRGWTETAWSCSGLLGCLLLGGAGSGCSQYEPKPSWQHDPSCSRRTIADVSAVADPSTGVSVYDTYRQVGWLVVGGTSVSAPIVAGVYALAGNASTVTYGSYPYSHHSAGQINDVTTGSTGSCGTYICNAKSGYDGPTGWGTPNGTSGF